MVLHNLCHQAIDPAPDSGQQHQNLSAIMILCRQLSLHRFHLPANPFHSVQQLRFFAIYM
jgi:hypothetical protein